MQIAEKMNVVFGRANDQRWAMDVLEDADHVTGDGVAMFRKAQIGPAMLGAENDVDQDVGEGLRHGTAPWWPLVTARWAFSDYRAAVSPGLSPWAIELRPLRG
jgi:hypothetical protein